LFEIQLAPKLVEVKTPAVLAVTSLAPSAEQATGPPFTPAEVQLDPASAESQADAPKSAILLPSAEQASQYGAVMGAPAPTHVAPRFVEIKIP
jgi:hypothetical protein